MKLIMVITRKVFLLLCCLTALYTAKAQKSAFDYSFYGFVRGDYYVNSRSNVEGVDGLFYLFPKDVAKDAEGKDLNATPNGSFYSFTTRFGIDMKGPDVGAAKTTAKVETDLGGTNNMQFMLRIRHAYLRLAWQGGSTLTMGQTWHPLFGEVAPNILDLSTGSPFQPFNRSPQISYQYANSGFKFTAAALWQLIYLTVGAEGKSEKYIKDGVLPELYAGLDYKADNWLVGGGVDMTSIKPRLQSVMSGKTYKVDERLTGFSYDLHAKYSTKDFSVSAKSVLAENQTHTTMIGGFGVSAIDPVTGQQDYVPFRHSTSWLNLVYGSKYQSSLFAGYTKNLGTSKSLTVADNVYGLGLDIDRFVNISYCLRYVLPHWHLGLEYTLSTAWYGAINPASGKVNDTHDVTNHRLSSVFMYFF